MAVSRRCLDGSVHKEEPLNKSQVFITTSGYKNTFPYDRLIGFLVRMLMQPERCMILGGTWRLPVKVGLQDATFIQDMKDEGECKLVPYKTFPVFSQGFAYKIAS